MPRAEPPQTTRAMAIANAPPPISRRTITAVANMTTSIGSMGAIATAGRVDGGTFHLGVAPAMLVAMLFLVWAGSGRLALDRTVSLRLAA